MTTSNKNFKVKNGLEVLGVSATVNGNQVLTTASAIDALSNVDTTGIVDGNTIVFNQATSTFIAGAISGGASFEISDTAPQDAVPGDVWYCSANGGLFIRLEDVDSEQWVQIGLTGPQGIQGEAGIVAQISAPADTSVIWLDTDATGYGIPSGGTTGQALVKVDGTDLNTQWGSVYSESETDALLAGKSDISHTHDSRYYTETETDTLLSGKSNTSHTHDDLYYTETEIDTLLSEKSDTSHTHDDRYYTESETDNAISTAIANVVDSAPEVLNTLNELSASLNDDPNFASTVASALSALVPSGTIIQSARSTAPTGYLTCDGSAISRTTYSSLFSAIGTAYGSGDGSTTFNIPNLKGRIPVGYDPSQAEFDALGETGGEKTVTLTSSQIPSHTHSGTTGNQSQNHTHGYSGTVAGSGAHNHIFFMDDGAEAHATRYNNTGNYDATSNNASGNGGWFWTPGGNSAYDGSHSHTYSGTTAGVSQDHTHNITTDGGTGGGQAHNNLQPYVVINYMIKI